MSDITWKITNIQCSPSIGSYTNVVVVASWACVGSTQQDEITVSTSQDGMCSIPFVEPEDPSTFIAVESLTEQQVLDWCWAYGVNKTSIEEQVNAKVDSIINPPLVTVSLPWV